MNYNRFNKEDILENVLKSKIEEIKQICYNEKIPFFISLCYKNTNDTSCYYNEVMGSRASNLYLVDDKFKDYINIVNGFITIPKRNELTIDEETMNDLLLNNEEE